MGANHRQAWVQCGQTCAMYLVFVFEMHYKIAVKLVECCLSERICQGHLCREVVMSPLPCYSLCHCCIPPQKKNSKMIKKHMGEIEDNELNTQYIRYWSSIYA